MNSIEILRNHVPYSDINNDVLETWVGTLISGISLEPLDIECADEFSISQVGENFRRLLNEFNVGFTYRITTQNIRRGSNSHRLFFLWIELPEQRTKLSFSPFKSLLSLEQLKGSLEARYNLINGETDRILKVLAQSGLKGEKLQSKQIPPELAAFFRPNSDLPIQNISALRAADLIIKDNQFFYDHTYWSGLSIAEYPDAVRTGQMLCSLLFDATCFTSVIIKPCDAQKVVSQLKQRRKISASLTMTNSRLRDLESEAKLQSEDELLESLVVGQEKVFECQVSSFVSGIDPQFAENKIQFLCDQYRAKGYQVYREALGLYPVFCSSVPGGEIEGSRTQLLPSSCVQALVPIFDVDQGHKREVLKFQSAYGNDVQIDPWDESLNNYNATICGTSGSGKSFFTNIYLKKLADADDPSTFIIDLGGSYRRLVALKGGAYLTFSLKGQNAFNPLGNLKSDDGSSIEQATDILRAILSDTNHPMSPLQRSILYQELSELSSNEIVTLSHLKERWKSSSVQFLKDSSTILSRWTGNSPYGALLDNDKILAASGKWTCFDLLGLNDTPDLQRVVMLAAVKRIRELIRFAPGKKVLILDEVWALVQQYSDFIGELFRTVRKHGAQAVAISQSLGDFDTEELRKAVLELTPTKIILKQSMPPQKLAAMLNLNDRETEIVSSLKSISGEYSEFFMINGDKRRRLRLSAEPNDYWLATTNPKDIQFLEHFQKTRPELTELQACNEIAKLYGRKRP